MLNRHLLQLLCAAVVGLFSLLLDDAQAELLVIDRIVAIVNDEVITLSEVQEAVLERAAISPATDTPTNAPPLDPEAAAVHLTPEALERQLGVLILRRLELQAARRLGIATTEEELRQTLDDIKARNRFASDQELIDALATEGLTLDQYRQRLRDELMAAKLISREVRSRAIVSPEEAKTYYDSHEAEFMIPGRLRLRQISFAAPPDQPSARTKRREEAEMVHRQLLSGADFAQLARRFSDGPEAGDGGDLGWFEQGMLTPELDQAAFQLKTGEVSGLIETAAGWHLLKVEDQEALRQRPFDNIKDALIAQLLEQKVKQLYEAWFLELRQKAYVDIRL